MEIESWGYQRLFMYNGLLYIMVALCVIQRLVHQHQHADQTGHRDSVCFF